MREFATRLRLAPLVLGASVLAAFASTGCVVYHGPSHAPITYTAAPPPRAAANGYAHRYQGVVLVFDRSWNGYAVRAHPGHYFYVDHYYRWHDGGWQKARNFRGPWATVELRAVPAGLRQRRLARVERRGEGRAPRFRTAPR